MKRNIKIIIVVALVSIVSWVINLIWYKPFSIDLFFERMFVEFGLRNPELLTDSHVLENYGFYNHNRELNNISLEYRQESFTKMTRAFEMLRSYKRTKLDKHQLLSYDILDFYLEKIIFKQQFAQHEIPLNHINGIHAQIPLHLIESQFISDLKDAENYLSRISKIREKIYQSIQNIMIKSEDDKPPRFVFDYIVQQIDCFLVTDIEKNLIYQDFKNKLEKANLINENARTELLYELKLEIGDNVYPAFHELKLKMEVEREHVSEDAGIWRYVDGDTYYYTLLTESLTIDTSMFDMEIWAMGEVERLHGKVADIIEFEEKEVTDNSVTEMLNLFSDKYLTENTGIKHPSDTLNKMLNSLFEQNGVSHLQNTINVKENLPFFNNYQISQYYPASLDNYRKASLLVSDKLLKHLPAYMLKGLIISEVFPGHHFQKELITNSESLPNIRKQIEFNAFAEGWKYYVLENAESLQLTSNKLEKLGCLQWQLLFASAAVVDLKIHQNTFSREEAISFMLEVTGLPKQIIIAVVDKTIVMPAKAPAFLVGFQAYQQLNDFLLDKTGNKKDRFLQSCNIINDKGAVPARMFSEVKKELSLVFTKADDKIVAEKELVEE
ncbi:DUF885 domain-containing protein [Chondrinema litorale]|uniref:DUF885 domain-containing protein n=1 Tax=Chondrinema litorale TaxID=2994555 RepID=UPI00254395F2|nr:DUF885 domain-containing protein [Chondrinema litorale]UZR96038.1 DUF885 domain-containing protein [Chondrinema litorale]